MRVEIDRKQRNIQHQTRHRDRRDLRLIIPYKHQKIFERISRELHEIVDDQAKDRRYQPKDKAQPEVVFFEYHGFHVFSSLLFRT